MEGEALRTKMRGSEWSAAEVDQLGSLPLYQLKTTTIKADQDNKIQILGVGPVNKEAAYKSVLLLGETGGGKTSAINTMVNYLYGVSFTDKFRFRLKDQQDDNKTHRVVESQTDYITMFVIYHQPGMPGNCNYILVDSPGLNDTNGNDKNINKSLTTFLTIYFRVDVHCIGIVAKANDNRLTKPTNDALEIIKSKLGKEGENIINLLATYARDDDEVCVKSVLKECRIAINKTYKIDNPKELYKTNSDDGKKSRWDYTMGVLEEMFKDVECSPGARTNQTQQLVNETKYLKKNKNKLVKTVLQLVRNTRDLKTNNGSLTNQKSNATFTIYGKLQNGMIDKHYHRCKKCDEICGHECRGTTWTEALVNSVSSRKVATQVVGLTAGIAAGATGVGVGPAVMLVAVSTINDKITGTCPAMKEKGCSFCKHSISDHITEELQRLDANATKDFNRRKEEIEKLISNDNRINKSISISVDDLVEHLRNIRYNIFNLIKIDTLSLSETPRTVVSIIKEISTLELMRCCHSFLAKLAKLIEPEEPKSDKDHINCVIKS